MIRRSKNVPSWSVRIQPDVTPAPVWDILRKRINVEILAMVRVEPPDELPVIIDCPSTPVRVIVLKGRKRGVSTICHTQPYWPSRALEDALPSRNDWRYALSNAANMSRADRDVLERLTKTVADVVPGYWSVDWLWTTDRGWVLTDMAVGDRSFRWGP